VTQYVKTFQKCPQCSGTGEQYAGSGDTGTGPFPCKWPGCIDGYIEVGMIELIPGLDDISDKIDDILGKCNDIFEKVSE